MSVLGLDRTKADDNLKDHTVVEGHVEMGAAVEECTKRESLSKGKECTKKQGYGAMHALL